MRDRKWQQRITLFLGIFLSFGMVAGLVTPLILNNQNVAQSQPRATNTPRPTQPAPPDTASITFDETYLHPSGLFTASIPTNYILTNEYNSSGEAQVTMENSSALSVLEIRVIRPVEGVSLESAEGISSQFTSQWLSSSWSRYSSWDEDARRVDGDRLIIDFSLERGGQDYVARQIAFADDTWIYTLRAVAPSNASDVMQYVLENEIDSFQIIDRYLGERLEWTGYFDDVNNHLLRFPSEWAVVDGAEGMPASVSGNNVQLRIETADATIDSADAASQYVAGLRSTISVLSVEPVEQYGNSGFRVAYTQSTADGDSQSGAVLIINGSDTAHVVNVLLADVADANLNTVDVTAEGVDPVLVTVREVLDSFSLFPDMDVSN